MAVTIVEATRAVTGGVDTHLDMHVAAALDDIGGVLGVESFPTTAAGYGRMLVWMRSFGPVSRVGVEGTGAYGAGLARHLHAAGGEGIEVDPPNRQARRQHGNSGPADDVALLADLSGELVACTAPGLLAVFGVGPDTAATLLVAAGDNPDRLKSEAAWAHLCGVAPIEASSGKVVRHRLNRGGDRQANS